MHDRVLEYDGFGMLSSPSCITRRVGGGLYMFQEKLTTLLILVARS